MDMWCSEGFILRPTPISGRDYSSPACVAFENLRHVVLHHCRGSKTDCCPALLSRGAFCRLLNGFVLDECFEDDVKIHFFVYLF